MNTDRELMQQALQALEMSSNGFHSIIRALSARLAQPIITDEIKDDKTEPVAWHEPGAYGNVTTYEKWAKENGWLPLYADPPQHLLDEAKEQGRKQERALWEMSRIGQELEREWVGLTDEERAEFDKWVLNGAMGVVYAIEAKLKEKNG